MKKENYCPEDYRSDLQPSWCKGCSYFSVLSSLIQVFAQKQIDPLHLNLISGIGCSSRIPFFLNTFGMHTLHGRALPVAIGARLARPDIPVVVVGGDGDLFSIGTGHFVHAARKNFNITVLCLDNRLYAMTKNQASPTSSIGYEGTLTPYGKLSTVLNVMEFSITCGATFAARTHCNSPEHMREMISCAMDHNGFSIVEILAPCQTFNRKSLQSETRGKMIDINKESAHDPSDRANSLAFASASNDYDENGDIKIPIGIYWKCQRPTFEEQVADVKSHHELSSPNTILDKLRIEYL